jgi:hypothetical protein
MGFSVVPSKGPKSGERQGLILALIGLLLLLGIIAVLYFAGVFTDDDVADIVARSPLAKKKKVVETEKGEADRVALLMSKFAQAEEAFKKENGTYSLQPDILSGYGELPRNMARANSPHKSCRGYYFYGLEMNGAEPLDPEKEFAIVGAPAKYGGGTKHLYIAMPGGRIIRCDFGGDIITNLDQVDGTWEKVE